MSLLHQPASGFDPGHDAPVPLTLQESPVTTQEVPAVHARARGRNHRGPLGARLAPTLLLPNDVADIAAEDSHGFFIKADRSL